MVFFFKQKTAYEMGIRDWSSDVCSSDLVDAVTPTTAIGEMRARMVRAHTRYPVIGDREEPIGVVQLAEVMAAAPDDTRPVTESMRAPLIVPELDRKSVG